MIEANVSGGGFVGERFAGGKRPGVGGAMGFKVSEAPSPLAKLPEREWLLDREVAVLGRRSPGGDGPSGGGGETRERAIAL
jgi:hypothetical protein